MTENTGRLQAEAMLAVGKTYRDDGLSVIPVAAASKLPVGKWKFLETQLISDAELERRYLMPYNGKFPNRLGVIGGKISGGLEMIDCDRVPRLDNISHMTTLRKTLEDFQPGVVVFDPAYLMLTTDKPESLFATGGQLSAISLLCRIHGATIIIAHHNSKSSNVLGRTPDLDDLSWSGFAEFARQWILVSRNKAYDPMTGDQHIKMVVGGSYGHGGEYDIHIREGVFPDRRWDIEMLDLGGIVRQTARTNRKEEGRRRQILEALTGSEEPMTANRLRTVTRINSQRMAKTLAELVNQGVIQELSDQQYITYQLTTP